MGVLLVQQYCIGYNRVRAASGTLLSIVDNCRAGETKQSKYCRTDKENKNIRPSWCEPVYTKVKPTPQQYEFHECDGGGLLLWFSSLYRGLFCKKGLLQILGPGKGRH